MSDTTEPTAQTFELKKDASLSELAAKINSRDVNDMYRPRSETQKINYIGLLLEIIARAIEEIRKQRGEESGPGQLSAE